MQAVSCWGRKEQSAEPERVPTPGHGCPSLLHRIVGCEDQSGPALLVCGCWAPMGSPLVQDRGGLLQITLFLSMGSYGHSVPRPRGVTSQLLGPLAPWPTGVHQATPSGLCGAKMRW